MRPRPCLCRHAVPCRLGIAGPQAEEHHRQRCPDETETESGLFEGSVGCARMSSCDDAPLGLHLGFTGFFTAIKEDVQRREYTLLLRNSSGNDIGACAWPFHESPAAAETPGKGGVLNRLTESRRGWFLNSYCQEHPPLPADTGRTRTSDLQRATVHRILPESVERHQSEQISVVGPPLNASDQQGPVSMTLLAATPW